MKASENYDISLMVARIRRYVTLLLEDSRFALAEKLSVAFSAISVCALCVILGTIIIVFLSIALGQYLSDIISPAWGNFIVAGMYTVILGVLLLFRRALIIDPIARFVSRLILKAPEKPTNDEKDN